MQPFNLKACRLSVDTQLVILHTPSPCIMRRLDENIIAMLIRHLGS